ncbi:hypothetical protein H696_01455 [Fonticula alba]|uniref:J domain-containing protein n=1 Tax=Fonticula alba TaxID=691883 RepID=A0A058ZEZ6_FONAL|nr:hypothetical protein H696_01455 [Fonticula alba]KCV72047.1 hypothetical protein H696_01455 [Fonticula alba]|eukprot:XP_009493625.1 hypothetical protein H696_01455 [Fonticula alba]
MSRIFAQVAVQAVTIALKGFVHAYRNATMTGGAAAAAAASAASSRLERNPEESFFAPGRMPIAQAYQVLGINASIPIEEFRQRYTELYIANSPALGGSPFMHRMIQEAKDRVELEWEFRMDPRHDFCPIPAPEVYGSDDEDNEEGISDFESDVEEYDPNFKVAPDPNDPESAAEAGAAGAGAGAAAAAGTAAGAAAATAAGTARDEKKPGSEDSKTAGPDAEAEAEAQKRFDQKKKKKKSRIGFDLPNFMENRTGYVQQGMDTMHKSFDRMVPHKEAPLDLTLPWVHLTPEYEELRQRRAEAREDLAPMSRFQPEGGLDSVEEPSVTAELLVNELSCDKLATDMGIDLENPEQSPVLVARLRQSMDLFVPEDQLDDTPIDEALLDSPEFLHAAAQADLTPLLDLLSEEERQAMAGKSPVEMLRAFLADPAVRAGLLGTSTDDATAAAVAAVAASAAAAATAATPSKDAPATDAGKPGPEPGPGQDMQKSGAGRRRRMGSASSTPKRQATKLMEPSEVLAETDRYFESLDRLRAKTQVERSEATKQAFREAAASKLDGFDVVSATAAERDDAPASRTGRGASFRRQEVLARKLVATFEEHGLRRISLNGAYVLAQACEMYYRQKHGSRRGMLGARGQKHTSMPLAFMPPGMEALPGLVANLLTDEHVTMFGTSFNMGTLGQDDRNITQGVFRPREVDYLSRSTDIANWQPCRYPGEDTEYAVMTLHYVREYLSLVKPYLDLAARPPASEDQLHRILHELELLQLRMINRYQTSPSMIGPLTPGQAKSLGRLVDQLPELLGMHPRGLTVLKSLNLAPRAPIGLSMRILRAYMRTVNRYQRMFANAEFMPLIFSHIPPKDLESAMRALARTHHWVYPEDTPLSVGLMRHIAEQCDELVEKAPRPFEYGPSEESLAEMFPPDVDRMMFEFIRPLEWRGEFTRTDSLRLHSRALCRVDFEQVEALVDQLALLSSHLAVEPPADQYVERVISRFEAMAADARGGDFAWKVRLDEEGLPEDPEWEALLGDDEILKVPIFDDLPILTEEDLFESEPFQSGEELTPEEIRDMPEAFRPKPKPKKAEDGAIFMF